MNRIVVFLGLLGIITILNIVMPDQELSQSERRDLAQFPDVSLESVVDGSFMEDFEKYTLDQFVLRENFRSIRAYFDRFVMGKKDVNGILHHDGHLIKMTDSYNQDSVERFIKYIEEVSDLYLKNSDIYLSVIPDKAYYIQDEVAQSLDYDDLADKMSELPEGITYIDIFNQLSLDDYYKTDTHWKQESLPGLLDYMNRIMDFETSFGEVPYSFQSYEAFYGVYYGQAALDWPADKLVYLTGFYNDAISITNYQYPDRDDLQLYDLSKLGSEDSYDVFLSGASPLIVIDNPEAATEKELILFRDSFGSSIAPLLTMEYSRVTVVDTRYVPYQFLSEFIEFDDQDVLFLYSTMVLNESQMLR